MDVMLAVVFIVGFIIVAVKLTYFLLLRQEYDYIAKDGKAYIRHKDGTVELLLEHMRKEHYDDYVKVMTSINEAKRR